MYIRLVKNIVSEIIPDIDPALPSVPIEARYPPEFVESLLYVPDGVPVEQNWTYDEDTGRFADLPLPSPEPEPTAEDVIKTILGG